MNDRKTTNQNQKINDSADAQTGPHPALNLIEEPMEDSTPLTLESLKHLVLSMGDDNFMIQVSLTGEEDAYAVR